MSETELKFQVPAGQRASVDAAVAGRAPRRRIRLQAAYFDTPDRALARAGLALRVRREGRIWVQTLKGQTEDSMTRIEHNVMLGSAPGVPVANPALHAEAAGADALAAVLAQAPGETLSVVYRTDILRRTRAVRTPVGTVELAFDTGRIVSGAATIGVRELEIELLSGSSLAVIEVARRWLSRHGLWLDSRSKAERGDLLARGETSAAPRLALPVALAPDMAPRRAWQVVLRSCADQIVVNASQIASGEFAAEHVHQLRVGLRRLRSAIRLFPFVPTEATLGEAAAQTFRLLGAARDQAVMAAEFGGELQRAWQSAGMAAEIRLEPAPPAEDPAAVVRDPAVQRLLLDLLSLAGAAPEPQRADAEHKTADQIDVRDRLAAQLGRWHQSAAADAKRFAELDDAARHRLRKRIKRLRYAVEFCEALFERGDVRRYLRPLRALQDRLGAINDGAVAMQAFHDACIAGVGGARAGFALGWLSARREVLVAEARPALKGFARAKPFWKSSSRRAPRRA